MAEEAVVCRPQNRTVWSDMNEILANNRRDQRRETILHVARDVFFEEGFGAASMSTIAARVGGSKGTLYNYFRSKEELFEAMVQEMCAKIAEDVFNLDAVDQEPVEVVLTRLGRNYLKHIYSEWAVRTFRLISGEAVRAPQLARIFYEAGPRVGRQRLSGYLVRARASGLITARDCDRAADQFMALCRGDVHFQIHLNLSGPPNDEEIAVEVDAAVAMFMKAYAVEVVQG